ncbi:Serine/arginine-rich splicing factor 1 [Thelohanellus kitauei]|uniref:Serine/arginine-rich splicing factor 1 n=1 Tax=Thelohanellus kitauei TaxID=669202 RepID=A0A0C2ML84_THEKT|nr:Serine/arginine-rich splicing factor 1 [Thelohanellus kitauei]
MSRRRETTSRIFVGNLPRDIKDSEVEDLFYKYGRIREVSIRSSRDRPRSFAFVEFDDVRDAEDAIRGRDGHDFDGFRIRVEPSNNSNARDRARYSPRPPRRNPPRRSSHRLHVKNFPASGSWQDLKDHMRQAGEVLFADVYKDGTAVVEFARYEDLKVALNTLQGSSFRTHEGTVKLELREEKASRSRSKSSGSRRSVKKSRSRSRSKSRSAERSVSRSRSRSSAGSYKRSASSRSRSR